MKKFTLIIAVLLFFSCSSRRKPEQLGALAKEKVGVAVVLKTITRESLDETLLLPAILEPWDEAEISFRISGRIANILVKEGEMVQRNQLLVSLEKQVQQADLQRATTVRDQAERNYQRLNNLYQSGSISQQDYEAALSKYNSGISDYKRSRDNAKNTSIVAPFAATVERIYVESGMSVNAGKQALYLINGDKLKARIDIPESSVAYISVGDEVELTYSRFNHEKVGLMGNVVSIAAKADNSQAYRSIIEVNEAKGLKAGMVLDGRLLRRRHQQAISIPLFSLIPKNSSYVVYLAKDGKALEMPIKIGFFIDDQVLVESGLDSGDQLIIEGQQFLFDGAKIAIQELS